MAESAAVSSGQEAGSPETDREALTALFNATNGFSWENVKGWCTLADLKDWHGVIVNTHGRVVELRLPNNKMQGSIPSEVGDLGVLREMVFDGNRLSGPIPAALGRCRKLEVLKLRNNSLTGSIPRELENLGQLVWLLLGNNALTASIPNELGNLSRLQMLGLGENALTGVLPPELGRLSQLRTFDAHGNKLEGDIPSELGSLRRCNILCLHDNKLSGSVPAAVGRLENLTSLTLGDNRLTEISLEFLEALRIGSSDQSLVGLDVNPLLRPPQTVMVMGVGQAISWWEDIARFGEGTSNKLKMVLVGLAEAGKTTVVRNITGKPIPKSLDRTVGIEITEGWKPVDGGPLEVSIWDFAGQADYFASHQIFLTQGSLFLLVVDLRELYLEATGGVKDGDPNGRVYRWLEMLHLRVPGAAVALVGTHTDAAEFKDPSKLEEAVTRLEQLITRYNEDKAKEIASSEAMPQFSGWYRSRGALDPEEEAYQDPFKNVWRRVKPPKAPIIHGEVFRTSLNRESTRELVDWVGKAVTLQDCPKGFNFPAVRAKVPTSWIEANVAMEGLKLGKYGKRYVTWREAVETFGYFMETKGTPIPDPEEILLRAMQHREAEGSVLLSLQDGAARGGGSVAETSGYSTETTGTPIPDPENSIGVALQPPEGKEAVRISLPNDAARGGGWAGILYLDPTWLIELIRRLTDHNLVDPDNQGSLKNDLQKYGEEHVPALGLNMLWKQHRSYRASGTLDLAYLRFLWLHRQLGPDDVELKLNLNEFNSVLATMEALLVLYRAPTTKHTKRALYVVPARLPEYGDEQVLEKAGMSLGDVAVQVRCSFRRSYAPPAIIGRFLSFSNARIMEARECWQHGAHVIWAPDAHDVLVYEAHSIERSGDDGVGYPGLVLCVKGNTPEVRKVLASLTKEVESLFEDRVHGYPGLCSVVFEDTKVVPVSDLTGDLCKHLDNRFDRLDATVRKVAAVTSEVLQAMYLAGEELNQYPRLLLFKPETDPQPKVEVTNSPATGSSPMVCEVVREGAHGAAAGGMQRETWDKWIHALNGPRKVRMVFICEHDMTEVECGPDGKGYLIEDLPRWLKVCLPLLQASLFAVRVAVGMVSHVDLPLNDFLAALAKSASTEVLDGMGTSVAGLTAATPLPNTSTGGAQQQEPQRLQKDAYAALCLFMQRVESPSTTCCGSRSQCSSCGSIRSRDCVCVSWKAGMVRVPNGKGGLVWVKITNETEYRAKIAREAARPKNGPHA